MNAQIVDAMDDAQILDEVKKGHTHVYNQLIERYESLVARTVHGMIGFGPEAEDIGQEVFIRFYKALNNFRGDASVGTYLTRIAINLCINELRKRKTRNIFLKPADELEQEIAGSSGDAEYNEEREIVQTAIQKLEPKFRSVIVLRLIDGYSTEETAKILKIPLGTVLSRLARGQQKLKKMLSPMLRSDNE
jgi:RNA polymerase sigma-70 factor (ECF subfamily)